MDKAAIVVKLVEVKAGRWLLEGLAVMGAVVVDTLEVVLDKLLETLVLEVEHR